VAVAPVMFLTNQYYPLEISWQWGVSQDEVLYVIFLSEHDQTPHHFALDCV